MKNKHFFASGVMLTLFTMAFVSCNKEEGGTPGNGVTFDGYNYSSVLIGNGQEWMKENLRTSIYSNGDTIENVTANTQWSTSNTGAWAHYDNNSLNEATYGKLYNWYAVEDSRNVCPSGWHVPSKEEWNALIEFLGAKAGGKMKSTGNEWQNNNDGASNESGFSGLPGGTRLVNGGFADLRKFGFWWSSTEQPNYGTAWCTGLSYWNDGVERVDLNKEIGMCIRCLKN
jgi:uncharacterized protein (TIGR02145 family)